MITGLTQKVLDCQNSGLEEKKVIDEIARIVYWYPPMRRQWNPDECGDFLCHFYPRILPMIRRYRYQGKPFECLLKVT
ncbi:MAG: hypothetical protein LBQ61_10285, partial [Spirochaetales bacterium]|nr:hypothetical protein [Spirochaetales bacterium]